MNFDQLRTVRARADLRAGRNEWYSIAPPVTAKDGATALDVNIYDEIGYFGVTASDFVQALERQGSVDRINLRLSSPGGDVFDGLTIYNRLKDHTAEVEVTVDGIAASIASVIMLAGDRRVMKPDAIVLIHDAHTVAIGNAADMRDMADFLDKASVNMSKLYARETGHGTAEEWREMMTPFDTRFNAEQAVEVGLAHAIDGEPAAEASWDLSTVYPNGRTLTDTDLAGLFTRDTIDPEPDDGDGGDPGGEAPEQPARGAGALLAGLQSITTKGGR